MPQRILIVAPSWIGDTIMMQPLLMRLKAQEPHTELHVLAPAWSAPLLARMPEVSATIENPFGHGAFDWAGRKALATRLTTTEFCRGEPHHSAASLRAATTAGFSQAYVLPNSWKSALVPWFAKIPKRTGYTGEARYLLLNDRRHLDERALPRLVDRYAALAGGADQPAANPRLTSTIEQQQTARRALGRPTDSAPVIFCPGAEYGPAKRWPARHFAALAARLDAPVWAIGSTKDAETGAEIERLSNGAVLNLCGRTNLEQAIDLIASARAVVSNDSGLMHVAAALDRPLAAIYGSSSPTYTPPLSERARILSLNLDCSPCFKRECPLGHLNCLNQLLPQQVLAALDHA